MHFSALFLASVVTLAQQVVAHGYVPQLKIGSQYIAGWDVASDPYKTPRPVKVVRATPNDSGFISDVTSSAITCSVGNNPLPSAPISASVPAGGTVQVLWNTWPLGHYGPVMNYLAKCPGSCSSYKGDSGNVWVKFQQETYANGIWASDALANNNHSYTVTIPSGLAPGEYILRHEILALHGGQNIGGAQFYPVCIQLAVTGSGTKSLPTGIALPGAYTATDPGIHFSPYNGEAANKAYVAPGGPVKSI